MNGNNILNLPANDTRSTDLSPAFVPAPGKRVKILIIRTGSLGDVIHALRVVTAIRVAMPDATIGWMVAARFSELLAAKGVEDDEELTPQKPVVNFVHIVRRRWGTHRLHPMVLAGAVGEIRRMRRIGYDVSLDFGGTWKEGLAAALSGVQRRAGFVGLPWTAAFFYSERFARSGDHIVNSNQALANQALARHLVQADLKPLTPQLPRDASAEGWVDAETKRLGISKFVLMNPGAGWGAKRWPAERYGEVAQALAHHDLATLVNMGPGEDALAEAAVRTSGGFAFPVRCTIGQLIALTRRAEMMIGGDTGPLHLAAALRVPVLGLFGDSPPEKCGPLGTKSLVLRHPESTWSGSRPQGPDVGLVKISAAEVVAAAHQLLDCCRD